MHKIWPQSVSAPAADQNTSGAGTAATVTYTAVPGAFHVIAGIWWSYSAAPTGGKLTLSDGPTPTLFREIDVSAAGPDWVEFNPPLKQPTKGGQLVITLAGGGGAIVAKLNICGHWLEVEPSS